MSNINNNSNIDKPYDKFLKELLSNTENAKSLIKFSLDKNLLSYIDLDSIQPIDTQKISKTYKQLYMDAAFRVTLKDQQAQVYFIIEHKSQAHGFSILQILSYMLAVWDYDTKNNKPLEPIIPIVFYHGQEPWKNPKRFLDYFKNAELFKQYIPDFEYILVDTNTIPDEDILNKIDSLELKAGSYLLKHIFEKDIKTIKATMTIIKDINTYRLEVFIDYIDHIGIYDENEVEQIFTETLGGEKMAPISQKWIEKGKQEGIDIGVTKGMVFEAQDLLLDAIEAKFGEVPKDIKLTIQNTQDRDKLRLWHKIVIKAQSLEEFRKQLL